ADDARRHRPRQSHPHRAERARVPPAGEPRARGKRPGAPGEERLSGRSPQWAIFSRSLRDAGRLPTTTKTWSTSRDLPAGGVDRGLDLLDRLVERGERRAALVAGQAFGSDRAKGARGSEILAAHAAERVLDRGLLLVVGDLGRRLLHLVDGAVDVPGR